MMPRRARAVGLNYRLRKTRVADATHEAFKNDDPCNFGHWTVDAIGICVE